MFKVSVVCSSTCIRENADFSGYACIQHVRKQIPVTLGNFKSLLFMLLTSIWRIYFYHHFPFGTRVKADSCIILQTIKTLTHAQYTYKTDKLLLN